MPSNPHPGDAPYIAEVCEGPVRRVVQSSKRPRAAIARACGLFTAPSFLRTLVDVEMTALSLTSRIADVSREHFPSSSHFMTSRSRAEMGTGPGRGRAFSRTREMWPWPKALPVVFRCGE